ncbi:restriction endonuclease subunit S [Micromonospora sp. PSH03]|uniref:restriction endonuclease subunit S n=1 Tax=Micromonospora salmantinae TaxID=2911211 RepID=UPI001EE903FC|nr:restriction endonuclease subunit S [Micromonospora salmantinae]MCG5458908.1 restriction endonuclease subunit S [Micromonospora salmantinae]
MTDLPSGWTSARLDEVAEVRLGRQRSPKNHTGDHMRPYLRAANVGWNGLKLDDVKSMNFTDEEAKIYRLQPGDIVLGEASGSPGEVGKPAIWKGEIEDCCIQNTLLRVRCHGPDPQYLLHFLRFEALRGAFVKQSRGVGIYHIGATRLSSWAIPIPPLAEQHRIVDALEDALLILAAGVANLSRSSARLDSLSRALMKALLGSSLLKQRKLGTLLAEKMINGRSVPTRAGGFPVLRLTALRGDEIDLAERKSGAWSLGEARQYLVHQGDFLVSRGNGSLRLVGRGGLVSQDPNPDPVAFPDTLIRVRVDKTAVRPEFLTLVWNSPQVRHQIEQLARTTAGIYKVNQAMLSDVAIPVPKLDEQDRIIAQWKATAQETRRSRAALMTASKRAAQLRISLLSTAFAGRLVPQDPDDEPASELLARIRAERAAAPPKQKVRSSRTQKELAAPPTRVTGDNYQQEALPL